MNREGQKKSEIKKDIEKFYGKNFIQNYFKFKSGDVYLKNKNSIIYVNGEKYMVYDFEKDTLTEKNDKCLVQVFFDHRDEYCNKNMVKEIDRILEELRSGKVWNEYGYQDGKYHQISQSGYFSGWFSETKISESDLVKIIVKNMI